MGLSRTSTGAGLVKKETEEKADFTIALGGNPNVGKSTVFNLLTGLRQHTGNWPGKTVANARGKCRTESGEYELVDIPGAYSLWARSEEERIARDFLCFSQADALIIVCDGVCLERNLNLVLQVRELGLRTLVCVNLMDEAERKGIEINTPELSRQLGLPVIGISAKKKSSREVILKALDKLISENKNEAPFTAFPEKLETAVSRLRPAAEKSVQGKISSRWLSLKLIEGDTEFIKAADEFLGGELLNNEELMTAAAAEREKLNMSKEQLEDMIAGAFLKTAEKTAEYCVKNKNRSYSPADRRADRLLTGKLVGYPLMLLLLLLIFYITIAGANYPSQLLAGFLFSFEDKLLAALEFLKFPGWLSRLLTEGVYRVLAWVVSVMLPPMAIFFPLFTLLEDAGYLPRVAYNLDKPFHSCKACGKQALTMCMGFGCNAAGVTGCRIIDSERERLLAILTNSFVPCNGRFPILICIMSIFITAGTAAGFSELLSAAVLTAFVVLSVAMSFLATKTLSSTMLKGAPSSFVLEMPPYRRPNIHEVIVRSIFDRTLFVLGRAAAVAAPAGALIWLMAHVHIYNESIINIVSEFLDPLGRFMGLDGVILIAFILGFPANEIVLPIIIMAYTASGNLTEPGSLMEIEKILLENGWTLQTALCTMLFALFHWPCSTTLLTIKKETGSLKWTLISALLPSLAGIICCCAVAFTARLI